MKVWIDLLTPKQVLFFRPLADELKARGHQTLLTSRSYREVEGLIQIFGLDVRFVGRHGGASLLGKLEASAKRTLELARLVSSWEPDCTVCFASPEASRVAFGLGVKLISVNDSPHAESVARLTIPLCTVLATPWVIPSSVWLKFGIGKERVVTYRALDPAAWLKRLKPEDLEPQEFGLDDSKRTVAIRVEESFAAYLLGKDEEWVPRVVDAVLSEVGDCNIMLLGRYAPQIESLSAAYAQRLVVPRDVFSGAALLRSLDVFVGMGGTMTAEAALLGIPAISAYQGSRLDTEEYLLEQGLLFRPGSPEAIAKTVRELLRDHGFRKRLELKAKRILEKMEDPVAKLISIIEETRKPSTQ